MKIWKCWKLSEPDHSQFPFTSSISCLFLRILKLAFYVEIHQLRLIFQYFWLEIIGKYPKCDTTEGPRTLARTNCLKCRWRRQFFTGLEVRVLWSLWEQLSPGGDCTAVHTQLLPSIFSYTVSEAKYTFVYNENLLSKVYEEIVYNVFFMFNLIVYIHSTW